MDSQRARLKSIAGLAWLLTGLSVAIVLVSGYIRLDGAGLGCAGWPDCYGGVLAGGPHFHLGAVRVLHRVTASVALLLGFFAAWRCIRPTPIEPVASYAAALVALMIALTLVGLWSSDPHRVWSSAFNMLGGLALVSLSWRMVLASAPARPQGQSSMSAGLLRGGIVALALTIVMGALIGARYAAVSCLSVPDCNGVWWPAAEAWAALNPFMNVLAPAPHGDAGGVMLHLLHRYGAVLALLLLGIAGGQALRAAATRRIGSGLLLLLVIELALGGLTVASGFKLWLAIAHSVTAALLLAAVLTLVDAQRRAPR